MKPSIDKLTILYGFSGCTSYSYLGKVRFQQRIAAQGRLRQRFRRFPCTSKILSIFFVFSAFASAIFLSHSRFFYAFLFLLKPQYSTNITAHITEDNGAYTCMVCPNRCWVSAWIFAPLIPGSYRQQGESSASKSAVLSFVLHNARSTSVAVLAWIAVEYRPSL
ncbi:hypothetical protein [Teredinibacter franksiae]|uniref:hypothetical protein n=1 Tax=Teredinibacter franksiae TaxID=2761453 RepID=UPI001C8AFC0C|nr:hypothetical protein [Teredinibacter franksiae]